MQDPRLVQTISVISLFEQQHGASSPRICWRFGLSYEDSLGGSDVICARHLNLADLLVAATTLLLTAPFVGLAAFS